MTNTRPKPRRSWHWVLIAVSACSAWALSVQFPGPLLTGPNWYCSSTGGALCLWRWLPAQRTNIEFGEHATPYHPVARWFFWVDGWGYGAGAPLWPLALLAVGWAAWRYAFSGMRQFPPRTRAARRTAAAAVILLGATAFGLAGSARHRTHVLLHTLGCSLTLENGALELGNTPGGAFTFSPTLRVSASTVGSAPTQIFVPSQIPFTESRQGAWIIDLGPDVYFSRPDWRVAVPLWPALLLAGWFSWRSLQAAARRSEGLCPGCGYALAGLPPGAACPECGREPPSTTEQHPSSRTPPA